jgi:ribosomal protein S12 methylthiotransferase
MVGFPGESEAEYEELLAFVEKVPLDHVGVFQFSLEKEAYAAKLSDQVPIEVKRDRFERLTAAQLKMVVKRNKLKVGSSFRAIIEGYHPESKLLFRARHSGQCPEIDGQIIINDGRGVDAFGSLYDVEITDTSDYDLIGRVVKAPFKRKNSCKLSLVSG